MSTQTSQPAWRVLLGYVRPFRTALVLGGLLSLATAASGLALPLVVRELIEGFGSGGQITGLLVLMTVLVLTNAGIGAFGAFLLERTAESVVLVARRQLVSRLLWLRIPALDETEPGDLMSRVSADTTLLREVSTQSLVSAVTGSLTLIATATMMALLDPLLLVVTLAALGLAQVVVGVAVPRISRAAKQAQESVGAMSAALERALGNLRTVKASSAEERERDRLHGAALDAWRGGVRAAKWQAVAGNTGGLAIQLSFIVVLGLGGARVVSGAIDVATLVAFLLYLFYLMPPMRELAHVACPISGRRRRSRPHPGDRNCPRNRMNHQHRRQAQPFPRRHRLPTGALPLQHGPSRGSSRCHLHHPGRRHDRVRRPVRRQQNHGLLTHRAVLRTRLRPDPDDGTDLRDRPLAQVRAAIGYVEQDAPVLSGTLRDNLVFGAPEASDTAVDRVLAVTRLEDMAGRLPDGLATLVGHRGIKLSGGERQRVAITRALLRRPRLLLLDEVTSQLDAVNEAALHETIADAARTTTMLVVAHRLSTVTMADRIVVMDTGQVRAIGTHAELVAADPLYAELAATQLLASSEQGA